MRLAVYRKLLTTYVLRDHYASTGFVKARIKEQSEVNVAGASRDRGGRRGFAAPPGLRLTVPVAVLSDSSQVML